MGTKRKVVSKPQAEDDDLLGFIDTSAIDDMLDGIDSEIPAYKIMDKIEFVHAGGKVKGSVHKVLPEGKLKAVDKGGTLYTITTDDILKEGETAGDLIARRNGTKKPMYTQTEIPLEAETKKVVKETPNKGNPKTTSKKELKKGTLPTRRTGEPNQRELVEALADKGERDYDKIATKTGVTRTNVSQYMYRWKKANPGKV